jgi:hypothetical protein
VALLPGPLRYFFGPVEAKTTPLPGNGTLAPTQNNSNNSTAASFLKSYNDFHYYNMILKITFFLKS